METLLKFPKHLPTEQVTSNRQMIRHLCPCCADTLLRHVRSGQIYWRCSTCYQEMPVRIHKTRLLTIRNEDRVLADAALSLT